MSAKRRDSKNRILRDGESQRPDGRYMYRYTDMDGKTQSIYSWRLVATDKVPDGKRDNGALRDRIKEIQKDLFDYVQPNGGGITVLQLVKRYTGLKTGVKESTKSGCRTVIKWLEKDPFGSKTIGEVKTSDANVFCQGLFPVFAVKIPCFHLGNFPVFGGIF